MLKEKGTALPPVKKINAKIISKMPPLVKKSSSKHTGDSSVLTNNSSTNITTKYSIDKEETENKDSTKMASGISKEKNSLTTPEKKLLKRPVISASTIDKLQSSTSQNSQKYSTYDMKHNTMEKQATSTSTSTLTSAPAPASESASFKTVNGFTNKINFFNNRIDKTNINKKANEIKIGNKINNIGYRKNSIKQHNFDLNKMSNVTTSTKPKSLFKNNIKYNTKINQSETNSINPSTKTFSTTTFKNGHSSSNKSNITNTSKQIHNADTSLNTTDDVYAIQIKKKELIQKLEDMKCTQKKNLEEVTQTNNKVIRRTKTKEIQEYECNFFTEAPPLFCENAYVIRPLPPLEPKLLKIKSILDTHKNEIIQLLKIWIENDKSCSDLMKKIMNALIEGDDSVLERLNGNKKLAEDILFHLKTPITTTDNLHSLDSENIPEDNNNT